MTSRLEKLVSDINLTNSETRVNGEPLTRLLSRRDAWKQQKEEQARARKKAADLAKCEARISELEEAVLRLDEEMALPENCMDLAKLGSLVTEKETLEQELEGLYEQWELLQS